MLNYCLLVNVASFVSKVEIKMKAVHDRKLTYFFFYFFGGERAWVPWHLYDSQRKFLEIFFPFLLPILSSDKTQVTSLGEVFGTTKPSH